MSTTSLLRLLVCFELLFHYKTLLQVDESLLSVRSQSMFSSSRSRQDSQLLTVASLKCAGSYMMGRNIQHVEVTTLIYFQFVQVMQQIKVNKSAFTTSCSTANM